MSGAGSQHLQSGTCIPLGGIDRLCDMEQIYVVNGMTCGHCTAAVEGEVSSVPGVLSVAADLSTKRVTVQGEDYADADVRAAIAEAGYEAA